ncbi:MAG: glycosyltransferase family 2 protein, partial [Chloroflexaceae bacterium]|nr:glycosyltransferase family 2 protein [Chloroflexaceae bacterium]
EAIGGFPASVTVGVDWDLGVRLIQHSYRCAYAEAAIVATERPATVREFWRNEVRWRRAHLHALWRHRGWFFQSRQRAVQSISFYLVAGAVAGAGAVGAMQLAGFRLSLIRRAAPVALLFLAWVGMRRPAFVAAVAAHSGNMRWLKLAWGPLVLLWVSFLAATRAALTVFHKQINFQGPRPVPQEKLPGKVAVVESPAVRPGRNP